MYVYIEGMLMFWINLLIASLAFFMKALDLKGVIAAFVVGTCLLMMDIFSYIILLSFSVVALFP